MRVRPGSARAWRIALGVLALLSYAAAISLTIASHQWGDGVIAAVVHTALEPTHVSVWLDQ